MITMNITEEHVEKAMIYLAETDEPWATAKAERIRTERRLKSFMALAKKASGAKSNVSREDDAYASDGYQEAIGDEFRAVVAEETLKAKRASAALRIEVWRSLSANRRRS